jgi:hypothetical protein
VMISHVEYRSLTIRCQLHAPTRAPTW